MKYIKEFNNHNAYTTFLSSSDYIKPNVSLCVTENEVHYNPYVHDYSQDYLTFIAKENGTFKFTSKINNGISYSTDGGDTWTVGKSVQVNSGDKVMWKGAMTPSTSYQYGIGSFSASTSSFDVQGNIMSLLYGDNFKSQINLSGKDYAFYELFSNTKVVSAKNLSLPATTLANSCYSSMFSACTSLTIAPSVLPSTTLVVDCYRCMFSSCTNLTKTPELPATTLAEGCCYQMFSNCTSLTIAPELPATTLANDCYALMFEKCTSLTVAPSVLAATTLANNCYANMFTDCSNLISTPALPATILTEGCYRSMFYGCTSLTSAPELPATTLAVYCYTYMFYGCTSLTTAPVLPAATLTSNCYMSMFQDCTNLNSITCLAINISASGYTYNWVRGVAASGTFIKAASMNSWTTGDNGIPSGWTVQDYSK